MRSTVLTQFTENCILTVDMFVVMELLTALIRTWFTYGTGGGGGGRGGGGG